MTNVEEFLKYSSQRLWKSYRYVRQACIEDEKSRRLIGPPYYTDHGCRHSLRMLKALDMVLFHPYGPFQIIPGMKAKDAYGILCSIFAHDIGMRGSALVDKQRGIVQLQRNFARKFHAEISAKYLETSDLIEWNDKLFPLELRQVIGRISATHNQPLVILEEDECGIDAKFCGALLKLLDCTDLSNRRIGLSDMRTEVVPIGNQIYAWKHYYVEDLVMMPKISPEIGGLPRNYPEIVVRYSFPERWRDYNGGDPRIEFDPDNPLHVMRGIAEQNLRYSHGDVPTILAGHGVIMEPDEPTIRIEINFADTDADGGPKMDFERDFLPKIQPGGVTETLNDLERMHKAIEEAEREEIMRMIAGAANTFKETISETKARLSDKGLPQCEETLEIMRFFSKYDTLLRNHTLIRSERGRYRVAIEALVGQGVVERRDGYYQLNDSYRDIGLVRDFIKKIKE